jgi:hypothetical protein
MLSTLQTGRKSEVREVLDSVFSPTSTKDEKARSEAISMTSGSDIEKDGKIQEHSRHQAFRNHLNKATIYLFWVVIGSLILGIFTYAWHMITPESMHYLTQPQFDKLQTVLVAAIVSSSLRAYVDQKMK